MCVLCKPEPGLHTVSPARRTADAATGHNGQPRPPPDDGRGETTRGTADSSSQQRAGGDRRRARRRATQPARAGKEGRQPHRGTTRSNSRQRARGESGRAATEDGAASTAKPTRPSPAGSNSRQQASGERRHKARQHTQHKTKQPAAGRRQRRRHQWKVFAHTHSCGYKPSDGTVDAAGAARPSQVEQGASTK